MISAFALLLALQAAPVDGPKTKLGLPADTRPIGDVILDAFPDPPPLRSVSPYDGLSSGVILRSDQVAALNRRVDCNRVGFWIDLASKIKKAKIEGEIITLNPQTEDLRWKEIDPDEMKYLDIRLTTVEANIEKLKLSCVG